MSAEEKMEKALRFLAETDAEFADTRVMVLRTEYLMEVAESLAFKLLEGGIEERKKAAKASPEVQEKFENHLVAVRAFEFLKARRKRAELSFEMHRSLNANRRQGGGNL
jgi:hypothetical protein